jgi:serpin B
MLSFPHRSLRPSLVLAALPALALAGCNGGDFTGTAVSASVPRDKSPHVAAGDETTLVKGNTDFAFSLYHQITPSSPTQNLFFSPYSVSLALAMTWAGAEGSTATQMASALRFTLPENRLAPAFDALDLSIQQKPAGATGADGAPFAINVADSLWGDQRVTFQKPFLTTLGTYYGAGLRTVDFVDQPDQAESAINNWVAKETNDKIDPLLGPGSVDSSTRFVIVNAVYFNASWASPFQKSDTHTGKFTRADGSVVTTPLMSSGVTATAYAKGSNWQAVELPYSGNTTSMVVVLPDPGAFAAVEHGLSGAFLGQVTSSLQGGASVDLTMPSFKIHGASVSLASPLQALGMTDAFDPKLANFTGAVANDPIYISDVIHQAFVDVDESGTEAAAATAVVAGDAAVGPPPVTVVVNRAFFFAIRDRATNTILFVGRETDPTAQ